MGPACDISPGCRAWRWCVDFHHRATSGWRPPGLPLTDTRAAFRGRPWPPCTRARLCACLRALVWAFLLAVLLGVKQPAPRGDARSAVLGHKLFQVVLLTCSQYTVSLESEARCGHRAAPLDFGRQFHDPAEVGRLVKPPRAPWASFLVTRLSRLGGCSFSTRAFSALLDMVLLAQKEALFCYRHRQCLLPAHSRHFTPQAMSSDQQLDLPTFSFIARVSMPDLESIFPPRGPYLTLSFQHFIILHLTLDTQPSCR